MGRAREAGRLIAVQFLALVLAFLAVAWIIRDYNRRHPAVPQYPGVCAYCGARAESYPAMEEHIAGCELHPLQRMRASVRESHGALRTIYARTGGFGDRAEPIEDPQRALAEIRDLAGRHF